MLALYQFTSNIIRLLHKRFHSPSFRQIPFVSFISKSTLIPFLHGFHLISITKPHLRISSAQTPTTDLIQGKHQPDLALLLPSELHFENSQLIKPRSNQLHQLINTMASDRDFTFTVAETKLLNLCFQHMKTAPDVSYFFYHSLLYQMQGL